MTTRTASFGASGVDLYDGGFKDYTEARLRKQAAEAELDAQRARSKDSNKPKANRAKGRA